MKLRKPDGIKAKVVVTVGDGDQGDSTVVLYRGGKTGLAFRSPVHRLLLDNTRMRRAEDATSSGASASAAKPFQQGGSQ
ncbi:MAG: hypothetical protein JSR62_10055 [Nitrospira sp.]|nr:hypothetical protein [Nitrospira sp.]